MIKVTHVKRTVLVRMGKEEEGKKRLKAREQNRLEICWNQTFVDPPFSPSNTPIGKTETPNLCQCALAFIFFSLLF